MPDGEYNQDDTDSIALRSAFHEIDYGLVCKDLMISVRKHEES